MTQQYYAGFNSRFVLSNSKRAEHVLLVIRACMVTGALHLAINLSLYFTAGSSGFHNEVRFRIESGDALIQLVPGIFLPIVFLLWFYRAYANLHTAGIQKLRHDKFWTIAAWFVPIMNLMRPYMIMKEIWYWTQSYFREKEIVPEEHTVVRNWWLSLFSPLLVGIAFGAMTGSAGAAVSTFYAMGVFMAILQLLGLWLLMKVVQRVAGMEAEFIERFSVFQAKELTELAEEYRQEIYPDESPRPATQNAVPKKFQSEILLGEYAETRVQLKYLHFFLWIVALSSILLAYTIVARRLDFDGGFAIINRIFELNGPVIVIAWMVATILFVIWINRTWDNLRNLNVSGLPGRAFRLAWWIIPLVNLYIPYIVLRQIWTSSQSLLKSNSSTASMLVLDVSWGSFLLSLLLFWVGPLLQDSGMESDKTLGLFLTHLGWVILALSMVTAIICIRRIQGWQKEMDSRVKSQLLEEHSAYHQKQQSAEV